MAFGLIIVAAIAAFGAVVIWYLFVRGPATTTVSRHDFDAEYDKLVASGDAFEADRDKSWKDFHADQVREERERLAWEEGLGE